MIVIVVILVTIVIIRIVLTVTSIRLGHPTLGTNTAHGIAVIQIGCTRCAGALESRDFREPGAGCLQLSSIVQAGLLSCVEVINKGMHKQDQSKNIKQREHNITQTYITMCSNTNDRLL